MDKKLIFILASVLVLLIIAGCTYYKTTPNNKDNKTLIDSNDKAINYARQDQQVKSFLDQISNQEEPWATYDENTDIWRIVFCAKDVMDRCYGISFSSDGKVTNRQDSFA